MCKKELLGVRIKEFREKRKMTQDILAELVGIDPKHLSRIENGRNYPSFDTLEKIVANLDVTFKDIFEFEHLVSQKELTEQIIAKLKILPLEKLKLMYKILKEI